MRLLLSCLFLAIFISGCGPKWFAEDIHLYYGLYTDGEPFMDWDGLLYYQRQRNGQFGLTDQVSFKASFGRKPGERAVELSLVSYFDEDGNYIVTGTYTAEEPFSITYLGSAEDDADHVVQNFDSGSGNIDFKGDDPFTYEKE